MNKGLLFACFIVVVSIYILSQGWHAFSKRDDAMLPSIKHLGVIMDGNRRWAKKSGLSPWIGHRKGVEPVKATISFCLKHNIPYLTLYAFSLENFKRSQQELDFLFNTLAQEIASKELGELFEQGIKVRFIGDRSLFPSQLVPIINDIEEKTAGGTRMELTILFCYGGRQELFEAAKKLAHEVKEGRVDSSMITQKDFEACLWTGNLPTPELIIRTGGMCRLSNFLPYQAAYSELYFLKCFWPDITEDHLIDALLWLKDRPRNFGA